MENNIENLRTRRHKITVSRFTGDGALAFTEGLTKGGCRVAGVGNRRTGSERPSLHIGSHELEMLSIATSARTMTNSSPVPAHSPAPAPAPTAAATSTTTTTTTTTTTATTTTTTTTNCCS